MDIDALRKAHPEHWMKAAAIRTLTLDAVAAANSGHAGMPMGMADVATVLFETGRIVTGSSCRRATGRCYCIPCCT